MSSVRLVGSLVAGLRRQMRRAAMVGVAFRPIFVAGAMGSGTSLVAHSVGARFDVAGLVNESALQVGRDSFLRVPWLSQFASVSEYERAIRPRPEWSVAQGRAALTELYYHAAIRRRPDIIDKGPNTNLVRAEFLFACFPTARFLLVLRDPVPNIEGFRRKWSTFGREPLMESVRFYRSIHEEFLRFAAVYRPPVRVIEYERLIAHRDAVLADAGAWLGLGAAHGRSRQLIPLNVSDRGLLGQRPNGLDILTGRDDQARERIAGGHVRVIVRELGSLYSELRSVGSS